MSVGCSKDIMNSLYYVTLHKDESRVDRIEVPG